MSGGPRSASILSGHGRKPGIGTCDCRLRTCDCRPGAYNSWFCAYGCRLGAYVAGRVRTVAGPASVVRWCYESCGELATRRAACNHVSPACNPMCHVSADPPARKLQLRSCGRHPPLLNWALRSRGLQALQAGMQAGLQDLLVIRPTAAQ